MKTFVLRKEQVPHLVERVNALEYMTSSEFDGGPCWLFDDVNLSNLMQVIGGTFTDTIGTGYEGIYGIVFTLGDAVPEEPPTSAFKLTFKDEYNGHWKEQIRELIKKFLLPNVDRNVVVRVPHGVPYQVPQSDKNFNILIWSQESETPRVKPPAKIFTFNGVCPDEAFTPSGHGIPIMDGTYAVAELIGNNLYIHHDCIHNGVQNELHLFEEILKKVVQVLTLSPEEMARMEEERYQRIAVLNKENYVNACYEGFQQHLNTFDAKVKDIREKVAAYQRELVSYIRKGQLEEQLYEKLVQDAPMKKKAFEDEYTKLINLDKIERIEVNNGYVEVFTDTLDCTNPTDGTVREIGKFKIGIPMRSGADVKWDNLTRKVDAYKSRMNAPHVYENGSACLGNAQEVFPELIANHQYEIAAMVAIQFIESVNITDTAGAHLNKWPLKAEAKSKETTSAGVPVEVVA